MASVTRTIAGEKVELSPYENAGLELEKRYKNILQQLAYLKSKAGNANYDFRDGKIDQFTDLITEELSTIKDELLKKGAVQTAWSKIFV